MGKIMAITKKKREVEMKLKWLVLFCLLGLFSLVGLPKIYAEEEDYNVPEGLEDIWDKIDERSSSRRGGTAEALKEALDNNEITQEQYDKLMDFWTNQWDKVDERRKARREAAEDKYEAHQDQVEEIKAKAAEAQERRKEIHEDRVEKIKEHLENVEAKKEELGTPPGTQVKPVNPPGPVGGPGAGQKVNPPGPKGGPGAGVVPPAVKADRAEDKLDRAEDVLDTAEDRLDRAEDIRDRREDIYDATHNAPVGTEAWKRDKAEDVLDRAEDKVDRREDVRDKKENIRDRREDRRDRGLAPDRKKRGEGNQGVFKGGKNAAESVDKKLGVPAGSKIKKLNNPNPTAGIKKANPANALKGKVGGAKNIGGTGAGKVRRK